MRKFLISVPVSAMLGKQGKNFTTAKIVKKVCKTLFVTVTILSPDGSTARRCIAIVTNERRARLRHSVKFLVRVAFENTVKPKNIYYKNTDLED